jgi:hypothetical protein
MSDDDFFDFDGDGDVDVDDIGAGFHGLFGGIDIDHDGVPDIDEIGDGAKGFLSGLFADSVASNNDSGYIYSSSRKRKKHYQKELAEIQLERAKAQQEINAMRQEDRDATDYDDDSTTPVAKYVVTQDGLKIGKQSGVIGALFNKVINKKSKLEISSNDACKMRVEDVMNLLYDAHFENVVAKRINDLRIEQREMEGFVTEIKINRIEHFAPGTYPVNSEIQIVYHELMLVYPPIASNHVKKRNKDEIANLFRQAGFVNVYLIPENDIIFGLIHHEDQVDNVSIAGDTEFKKDKSYKIDVQVSIAYHSRK